MADGSTKAIKDIKVGDEVVATDPVTGEQGPRIVTHLWVHEDELVALTVNGKVVTTTEDHPFWNATDQEWQRADELDPGDLLRTPSGAGTFVETPATGMPKRGAAYNRSVDDLHTYYVLVGESPVLVHNTTPGGCGVSEAISRQKRSRHILGDPLHNGGGYFRTHGDAQEVLDAFHSGRAAVVGRTANGNIVVRYDGVTGFKITIPDLDSLISRRTFL
ncbi:polymorphic toxin-type HINT domain-containing protein [Micromonospora sp. RTGN7]|uniref:polymorphic toxin-type HINT domain-containing protein n=1 Tax=Micromonospora sp. RTGN7 TaxID=3016526 RepID=UPI0039B6F98D